MTAKNYLVLAHIIATLLVVGGVSGQFAASSQAESYASTVVFSNTRIVVTAESNSTSEVSFSCAVTNNGSTSIASFPIRFDLRSLELTEVQVGGVAALTDVAQADTYVLVTVTPAQPIESMLPVNFTMSFIAPDMQQNIGLTSDGLGYLYHLIYYLRTLNEIRNLTMSIAMPPHAILEQDVAAPLFPDPTFNYTDGERLVFVWFSSQLLPGQEIAFIVKYDLPLEVATSASSALPTVGLVAGSILIGAVVALSVERVPKLLAKRRSSGPPQLVGISDNEAKVVQFLTRKGGSCTQREIYEKLNLSQSMVSTILTTLEQRGTIRRFKDGRENIVHLME
jgi:uncharacterized membrane protein